MEEVVPQYVENRNVTRVCRDAIRKPIALLELNLAKDVKNKKMGFLKYISRKMNTMGRRNHA